MASLRKEERTTCTVCDVTFNTWIAYHRHKIQSKRHICCEICSQDFNNEAAFKQHHDLMHSAEQDLTCPNPSCKSKPFPRLGSLIQHIELGSCSLALKIDIQAARKEKFQSNALVRSARDYKDFSRTPTRVSFGAEPHPLAKSPGLPVQAQQYVQAQQTVTTQEPVPAEQPIFVGDNLIGDLVAVPNAILNSPWADDEAAIVRRAKTSALPPLSTTVPNVMDAPAVSSPAGNAWAAKINLFPDAPPAVAPPPAEVAQPDPEPNPFDPDSPTFVAGNYYIQVLGKFKCPYSGCGKAINSLPAFIQHLKSPAHRNEKLQCTQCLRYYDTATALTQHMESQGVRCKVREAGGYEAVVDQVTGGVALPFGRHLDNTVKYVVNESILSLAGGVAAANKAANEKKNENFNDYWSKNQPKW